jgi:hypothetical protein
VFGAFVEGWRRVLRAPGLAIGVLAALLLVSVPLAVKPGELVGGDIPSTLRSVLSLTAGPWLNEAPALPLSPGAAVLEALLGFGRTLAAPYLLFWLFLSGGLLDRLARGRPVSTAHFCAVSGVFLIRFVRLAVIVAAAYYLLFRLFRPQISSQPELFAFLAGVALVNLVTDFAKVRAVVEDRRSMLSALAASLRFIRTHPVRAGGLFAMHVLVAVGILQLWPRVAPLPQDPWSALGLAAIFLLVMIIARLAFLASEVALFQAELAHATYTATPDPIWPDSPAVEAIQNFTARQRPGGARSGSTGEGYESPDGSTW